MKKRFAGTSRTVLLLACVALSLVMTGCATCGYGTSRSKSCFAEFVRFLSALK